MEPGQTSADPKAGPMSEPPETAPANCGKAEPSSSAFVSEASPEQVNHLPLASELSYRQLFETAQDGLLVVNGITGRITAVNPFLFGLLGYSREEMIGKTITELNLFGDWEVQQMVMVRLNTEGWARRDDLRVRARNGAFIEVELIGNLYSFGEAKVIQFNIRDITQRKRVELQLKASFKEIVDLKFALDEHAITAITDPTGKIIYVNDKFCEISKYSRAELLGQDHRILNSGHHPKEFFRDLWSCIARGRVWKGEIKNKAKDGTFYWVDTTLVPFLNEQGKPRQYVAIRADITERKQAVEQIRRLNAELEQRVNERTFQLQAANKELEAFSYSVSHDLRAPLRQILGFVKLLREESGPAISTVSQRYLTTISESAQRMGQLIDDLLAFSRVGRAELHLTEVNLDLLVRETVADLQGETQGRTVVWTIQPLPPVVADRSLLKLVLVNLISNAVKFTSRRAEAAIQLGRAASDRPEVVIYIRDNGAGFDPNYSKKLFGVFERLHNRHEFEGTGIGLANVQRIIHRHGGRVWGEGQVDQGATFYFSLPAPGGKSV